MAAELDVAAVVVLASGLTLWNMALCVVALVLALIALALLLPLLWRPGR